MLSDHQQEFFLHYKLHEEKSLSNNTQNINQNNTNQYNYQPSSIYETRRKNYQNDLKYSRDQEFAKESVKIPYMPRMLPKPTERATT